MDNKRLFILDGTSLIYKSFHAIPHTFTSPDGAPSNAVYGFAVTLRKILKTYSPDYIAVAFDLRGPTFRHEIYPEYKAGRPPMPDELGEQFAPVKQFLKFLNIPVLEVQSYEADDIIAAVAKHASIAGLRVAIVTSDKDMYQLVDDKIIILDTKSGKEYGVAEVKEKFGVTPVAIRDLLALAGDSSDNIPGVPGVGPKTAVKLLNEFGSIDGIYEGIESVKGDKLRLRLKENKELAYLSRTLVTLDHAPPIDISVEEFKSAKPDYAALIKFMKEYGFTRLTSEVRREAELDREGADGNGTGTGEDGAAGFDKLKEAIAVERVVNGEGLNRVLKAAKKSAEAALTILYAGEDAAAVEITDVGLCIDSESCFYIPVESGKREVQQEGLLFASTSGSGAGDTEKEAGKEGCGAGFKIDRDLFDRFFVDLLTDKSITKQTDNAKLLHIYALAHGVEVEAIGIESTIASYLLDPVSADHSITVLSEGYLGATLHTAPNRKKEPYEYAQFTVKSSFDLLRLAPVLEKKLEEEGLEKLYDTMELPLTHVLASMEVLGIKVSAVDLKELSKEIEVRLAEIEDSIYAAAGREFNINSPKQLSVVLFDEIGLKPVKKTKTGYSTNEDVLKRLSAKHEVPGKILSYRGLAKLKSTYVDAILALINPATGRLHTTFNQTVTATGRLSSSRPNIQNIPIRGELASRIRAAFIAEDGYTLLSADYSQIELRIVAHMANDPTLIEAFNSNEDIHTRTASEIFSLEPELVTQELRRRAKAINFGIIYGMGAYGLSSELDISMGEAQEYIDSYFAHYGAIKAFIDSTIDTATREGVVTTLYGRRRFVPELLSSVDSVRRFGARMAVNTPIQGTAADIIKVAMIRIDSVIKERGLASKMLLQIHDELLFEVAKGEEAELEALVRKEMEGVAELTVKLKVNINTGKSWSKVEE